MKLIDADALRARMYHDAFEADTDLQKWESGCWIRYKMFENAMDDAPDIDAAEVVRCKECRWSEPNEFDDYDCRCHIPTFRVNADGYCSYGERKGE